MDTTNNTAAQTESKTSEEKLTLQDIEPKYFGPDILDSALGHINNVINIAGNENVEPVFNFDPEGELKDGYGLSVIPITKRVPEKGNKTVGIAIAALPDFDTLYADDNGRNWLIKQTQDSLMRQVKAAAKPKDEGALISLPFEIAEFITTTRTSGLLAFNAVGSLFVSALKKKGLKFMTKVLLRQVLASAAFAEQQFPRIAQENWEIVLNSMVGHVEKENIDAGVLKHWLQTRNETEIDTTELDLSDIDSMVDGDSKDDEAVAETATA